jgi:Putative transposase/Transposase zinc-binding domain
VAASTGLEVADIVRQFGPSFLVAHGQSLRREHRRALGAIEACRTAALGGHLYRCERCDFERPVYNSCRNRHCPKCQALASARWVEARHAELLPVPYFHLVFTVPESLRPLFLRHPRTLYGLLFRTVAETLLEVAADRRHLGARIGLLALLHTWTQTLLYHPHLHVVVPGGGLTVDGARWVASRAEYFLPVRVLSRLFRGKLLAGLKRLHAAGELACTGPLAPLAEPRCFAEYLSPLYETDWVVYAKPPFGGPEKVLAYLARYTHRIAISNHRLLRLEGEEVIFTWRDRAHGDRQRTMRLHAHEFLRRLLLHVLPDGFVRIRSYGLLANRGRHETIARCREALGAPPGEPSAAPETEGWCELLARLTGTDPGRCPECRHGRLLRVAEIPAQSRAPPRLQRAS